MQAYLLYFYVPESHLEAVKQAVFDVGAGRQGNYDQCCWQTKGTGQFRPLEAAKPHIGMSGVVEQIPEVRVEMICEGHSVPQVRAALIESHPYEEVAHGFLSIT